QAASGHIFITEFGSLAQLVRSTLNPEGALHHSVPIEPQPYLAPEQLQSSAELAAGPQPASDLYALGLIAIEALTGRCHQAFPYDPHKGLLWREHIEVSLHLAEFIDRLVRHHWRDRFADAETALQTLKLHSDRHKIAQDSRLPTVIAAPGLKRSPTTTTWATAIGANQQPTPIPLAQNASGSIASSPTRWLTPSNPYLSKLALGSIAAVLLLGIGVKAYQWSVYRINTLPDTLQDWKTSKPTYPAASPSDLAPLLEDGSILLRPTAAAAFWEMVVGAAEDGVVLYALSGHRADEVDTIEPDYGTGYALDIGGETEASDRQASFAETEAFAWLSANAQDYGFVMSVTKDSLLGGKSDEPWHWRYVGDAASQEIFGGVQTQPNDE
ncbi:MAG: hypothetical protein HC800_17095, partial [Phormidesmis sp. RL_2_1]|nr:hypothetical protein [Phormidesmis sp. RL_2_1]